MSKYEEALDKLVHYLVPFHCTATKENAKMINDCLNTFKELVDKETAKKIIYEERPPYQAHCPRCNGRVADNIKYCWNCGQRLDWSDKS